MEPKWEGVTIRMNVPVYHLEVAKSPAFGNVKKVNSDVIINAAMCIESRVDQKNESLPTIIVTITTWFI